MQNSSFTGEYNYSLDDKNRVNIPAKFRRALGPESRTFVVTRGFDECLILYPSMEWKRVEEQLVRLSSLKVRDRGFIRSIVRHATYIQFDSQGRISIPDNLIKYSYINKKVTIIGMINKIELWDPEILSKSDSESTDISDKSFEDLANEIDF
tara:strand:+ start:64 stop:519 length:456 start_codon:yes stop_codon:yes gene_type:complete